MSREIKYRVYQRSINKMFYPGEFRLKYNRDQLWHPLLVDNYQPKQKDFVMLQWTGLLDRNGKEIYEGDVISSGNGSVGVVQWRHGGFEQNMVLSVGWWVIQEDGEVIGNIYENENLLAGTTGE